MFSKVGSTNWYGYAAVNNYRLSEILSDKVSAGRTAVSPIERIKQTVSKSTALSSDTVEFLKDYQNNLNSLSKTAKNLMSSVRGSVASKTDVASSDKDVLAVTASFTVREPASYKVEVKQLAQAQVNASAMVKAADAPSASGEFILETAEGKYSFDIDPSFAANNKELYNALAMEINDMEAGVTAQVVENGKNVSLVLKSENSGENNAFKVSGAFSEAIGVDKTEKQAQDAIYTVERYGVAKEFKSSSNKVNIAGYQIQAELKKTGTSTVTAGIDVESMAGELEKLVNKFNDTVDFLKKNADRGVGVQKQLERLMQTPVSKKSMEEVGITIDKDGKYSFNKDEFSELAEKNPALLKEIVSGSYGIAQGLERDAKAGMNMPSASLVSASVQGSQSIFQQTNKYDTMLSVLNIYGKNGTVDMNNVYTMGLLMNMYA
ncbi:MAG: flagellar filament capping protein FliD [Oscillospiraceae bacterium]|nr:flagellar filament capping protein FliD [Oscillospiraceae bacterium]